LCERSERQIAWYKVEIKIKSWVAKNLENLVLLVLQLVMGLICRRISRKDGARAATATKRSISQAESDAR
jgi:hypothetical protein